MVSSVATEILLIRRSIALYRERPVSMSDTPLPLSSGDAASPGLQPSDFKVYKAPASSSGSLRASMGLGLSLSPHSCPESEVGELPESYFIPSAADLKAAQATLTARTQTLVNAPFQLRATREATERAKRDRWPNVGLRLCLADGAEMLRFIQTTIRVRFSDRTQLEKTFSSSDKIRSVYAFVRSSLRDGVKPIKFILCPWTHHHLNVS